jgi:hypothetical protein
MPNAMSPNGAGFAVVSFIDLKISVSFCCKLHLLYCGFKENRRHYKCRLVLCQRSKGQFSGTSVVDNFWQVLHGIAQEILIFFGVSDLT